MSASTPWSYLSRPALKRRKRLVAVALGGAGLETVLVHIEAPALHTLFIGCWLWIAVLVARRRTRLALDLAARLVGLLIGLALIRDAFSEGTGSTGRFDWWQSLLMGWGCVFVVLLALRPLWRPKCQLRHSRTALYGLFCCFVGVGYGAVILNRGWLPAIVFGIGLACLGLYACFNGRRMAYRFVPNSHMPPYDFLGFGGIGVLAPLVGLVLFPMEAVMMTLYQSAGVGMLVLGSWQMVERTTNPRRIRLLRQRQPRTAAAFGARCLRQVFGALLEDAGGHR